ncbi:alpha/beta fold hydrolase [Paraburkholderia phenoliruptrix]|uniref:alpha/beta fold hydrolase n=1 Tax=Paraburkholderia phenoliruptrix TaxID=252970 RepID=UPI002869C4F5|nr:alpha/beta hydrolase [Paraburkholderia phenoliruptrix]WMY11774.1 alpha/beta hydrolase [Paraburkholderia phenoliruptrix]
MEHAQSNYADLGDMIIHYLSAGEGPETVVLLHGIPQTSYEWRYIIPQLSTRYRIIAPDLRGLGDTSRPATGYDKKTVASDVWRLVHDHLGIKEFFLAGHDWGGPVAFALTTQHEAAVKRLAILDVVIPGDGGDFSQNGRRWHHAFYRTLDLPEALSVDREELVLDWFFDHYGYLPNCISVEARQEYYRTYKKPGAFRAMFEYYRAMPTDISDNKKYIEENGKLSLPVLALGGDKSFGRGIDTIDSLKRVAKDVRGGLIPNSGHWIGEEAPDFIAEQLLKFFGEH